MGGAAGSVTRRDAVRIAAASGAVLLASGTLAGCKELVGPDPLEGVGSSGSRVYLFNMNDEDMNRIQIRTFQTTSTIEGWSYSSSSRYQPKALAIERFKRDEDRFGFAQGDNQVAFSRPSFNGSFKLSIDSGVPLSDDLILYVFRAKAILMRTNGEIIEEVSFNPTRPPG
jgi:hypothetical protein